MCPSVSTTVTAGLGRSNPAASRPTVRPADQLDLPGRGDPLSGRNRRVAGQHADLPGQPEGPQQALDLGQRRGQQLRGHAPYVSQITATSGTGHRNSAASTLRQSTFGLSIDSALRSIPANTVPGCLAYAMTSCAT